MRAPRLERFSLFDRRLRRPAMIECADSQLQLRTSCVFRIAALTPRFPATSAEANLTPDSQEERGVFVLARQMGDECFKRRRELCSLERPSPPRPGSALCAVRTERASHGPARDSHAALEGFAFGSGGGDLREEPFVGPFTLSLSVADELETPFAVQETGQPCRVCNRDGHTTPSITSHSVNPEYAQMARHRITDDAPLLNVETA